MNFDLYGALEGVLWALLVALIGASGALLVWALVTEPVMGLVVAYFALAFIIGGFWPRK